MNAEYSLTLEGWPINVTCYRICTSYVTQIESAICGSIIARGIAATQFDSEEAALKTAKERLLRPIYNERTVGG